jgi:hypothetical protein
LEYTTISQAASEIEGAYEEPAEQSSLLAADDNAKVENDINDDNLNVVHDDTEVDDNVDDEIVKILSERQPASYRRDHTPYQESLDN